MEIACVLCEVRTDFFMYGLDELWSSDGWLVMYCD